MFKEVKPVLKLLEEFFFFFFFVQSDHFGVKRITHSAVSISNSFELHRILALHFIYMRMQNDSLEFKVATDKMLFVL